MPGLTGEHRKLLLAGGILLVAGAFFYLQFRGRGPLPARINFVCVATGKTFSLDRKAVKSVPMKNPSTGQDTLLPCYEREGQLYVDPHYKGALKDLDEVNKHVDPKTLQVRQTSP